MIDKNPVKEQLFLKCEVAYICLPRRMPIFFILFILFKLGNKPTTYVAHTKSFALLETHSKA